MPTIYRNVWIAATEQADVVRLTDYRELLTALELVSRGRVDGELCWCDTQRLLTTHSTACLTARAAIAKAEGR